MNNRRDFFKKMSSLMVGSVAFSRLSKKSHAMETFAENLLKTSDDDIFWKIVKEQFPLNKKRIYLNNGTMGPCPYPVMHTVNHSTVHSNVEVSYGGGEIGREKIANFVNAQKEEISLTHNATEGINLVVWGLPLKKGDEVITTTHEHVGMATPLLNRARLHGIVLKPFEPATTAAENLNRIDDLITKKTRAIAVAHITCTNGLVLPAKEISTLAQDKGLFTFFDGAHAPGSILLDMKNIDCDFYAACGHKWLLAPLGTGFMYVKKELLNTLQTYHVGGHAITDGNWELSKKSQAFTDYVDSAHRYDYGTQNPSLPKGMAAAVDFFNTIGVKKAVTRGNELAGYLQKNLMALGDRIEMLTPTEEKSRASMITFRIKDMDYHDFGKLAGKNKFTIRLVWEAQVKGIRVSTHLYNNIDEVDQFVDLVKSII